MDISFNGGRISGKATAPPSKSCTHRAIFMAALSGGRCELKNPLMSADTLSTIEAVKKLGASVSADDGIIIVDSEHLHAPDGTIDAGNSGTTLRMMAGISSLFPSETKLTGDASLRRRPMQPLLDALETCGAVCESEEGHAPISVKGPIRGDSVTIDCTQSSQYASSLLTASPMVGMPMEITLGGNPVSEPYIGMTVDMMERFGASVERRGNGFAVEPARYKPTDIRIPGDWSSAAFLLTAGCLSEGVTVEGLDGTMVQGDMRILDILKEAGCRIQYGEGSVTCSPPNRLKPVNVDMSSTPDLFPVIAVLMSVADGESRLYGASHLRYKETDRIASTASMLKTLGAEITVTDDGCIINGTDRLRGGRIVHGGDHRLMMSAAVASLVSDGPVSMENDGCWRISYPGFVDSLRGLGMRC